MVAPINPHLTLASRTAHTLPVLAGRKKYPGMSPKMLLRVGQWESQTVIVTSGGHGLVPIASSTPSGDNLGSIPSTAATSETKRYSFQPKTISPSSSYSTLPPRSMSVETRPSSGRGVARFVRVEGGREEGSGWVGGDRGEMGASCDRARV